MVDRTPSPDSRGAERRARGDRNHGDPNRHGDRSHGDRNHGDPNHGEPNRHGDELDRGETPAANPERDPGAPSLADVKTSFSRARLHHHTFDEGDAVVKDFGSQGFWLRRIVGPFLLDREERAYARLRGLEGFPRWSRRVDRTSLAIERVEGDVLGREAATRHGPELIERLAETVERMHRRGVVHLDLHQKRNILVSPEGRPTLIDFATSLVFRERPDGRPTLLQRLFERVDRAAILKFRARYFEATLSTADRHRLRRHRLLSHLWISRPLNGVKKLLVRRRRSRQGDGKRDR